MRAGTPDVRPSQRNRRHQSSPRAIGFVLLVVVVSLLSVAMAATAEGGSEELPASLPEDILRQTFHIRAPARNPARTGTAFTVEMDGRQYIVTAQHVLGDNLPPTLEIQVSETEWRELPVTIVGVEPPPLDVAVLATDSMLGSRSDISVGTEKVEYGQEVRFLGYPFGWHFVPVPDFREAPLPIVKAGILSSMSRDQSGFFHLWIDATANKGFSGGPLVMPRPKEGGEDIAWHVVGLVTDIKLEEFPVKNKSGDVIGVFVTNAGMVKVISIDVAKRMIRGNPIGHPVVPLSLSPR